MWTLALIASFAFASSEGERPADRIPRVAAWLDRMEAFGVHGALLVAADGEVLLERGLGVADRRTGRQITPDTVFNLGSLSKSFTAAAVLRLVDLGRLELDDPLSQHLDAPDAKADRTLRELIGHTAGLSYQSPQEGALLASTGPRGTFSYSNPGYELLAMVVEAAAGEPYETFLAREIFGRAGLTRTCSLGTRPWPFDDGARAYTDDTDQGDVSEWSDFQGAGGVASTVRDLLRVERAMADGRVLSDEAREIAYGPIASMGRDGFNYGGGWMLATTERGTRVRYHQGNHGGFNADCRVYEDEGIFLAFLSNHFIRGRSMRDAVVNDVSRILQGGEPERRPPPVARDDLDRFPRPAAGTCSLEVGGSLRIDHDGDALSLTGLDEAGAAAVFSPAAGEEPSTWTGLSVEITKAVAADDDAPLRARLSRGLPFEGTWRSLRERGASLAGTHGPLVDVVPVLTAATDAGCGRSIVALRHEDGAEVRMSFTWDRGRILHIAAVSDLPSRRFLPSTIDEDGAATWRAFDIFTGSTRELRVDASGAARLESVRVTPAG